MTKPLSLDLRQRVIDAINAGQSCRAAAARFGIAPSAAVKWHRLWRETGSVAPRPMGGDKRSERIEALGPAIFAMVEEAVHITLAEIAARLEAEHGQRFAPSTVHRFFRRHGWTFKKSRPTPPSRRAPMLLPPARRGSRRSRIWTPNASSS
ncbi:MAG: winged helix-turn-helix domain-containing protein [Pseudomonadota bacterium]